MKLNHVVYKSIINTDMQRILINEEATIKDHYSYSYIFLESFACIFIFSLHQNNVLQILIRNLFKIFKEFYFFNIPSVHIMIIMITAVFYITYIFANNHDYVHIMIYAR